jgi:RNA polymerase sigma-70 factor (sigma-E family)
LVLVASGGERRRWFVAALFALADGGGTAVSRSADRLTDDGTAFADDLVVRLFHAEARSLVRLARLFTDDRGAAEDLVQEAFIRLHRSAARIRDPEKAAPYLRSIVLNLARDHNRRGLMSLRHQEPPPPDPGADPLGDVIVDGEDHRRVIAALRDLPPRQRDCLTLRYYYDLTERETAETLGISPNSVKTHCRRGLATLEKRVGER